MKLEEIARRSIEIIRSQSPEGVGTADLARQLNVPKRRVYDIKAIMKAANLITTTRDKAGTKMFWNELKDEEVRDISRIRASKIKITTTGHITSVSNRGTEVIIEGTAPSMQIESIS